MTDRPTAPDRDPEGDAELERRLRAAFGRAAVPEAPAAVHVEVARLAAGTPIRTRAGLAGWLSRGWVAVGLAISVLVVGSLFSGGSSPAPTVPPSPSVSADASVPGPSPSAGGSGTCDVSPGTMHGTWWREIGGPNAFFNWEAEPRQGAGTAGWKLFVRFDPDAGPDEEISVWAGQLGSDVRALGQFNSRMDPSNIYSLDSRAPDLPGGWYLFEQPLPAAGCWRLSAAIDGRAVGTAFVEVVDLGVPAASPSPNNAPTPAVEATPWPEYTLAPAVNDVLALAGRDGPQGMLYCHNMPLTFDALTAPLGAEVRVGPEFDALRSYTVGAPDRDGSIGLSFREVSRDAQNVLFLHERDGYVAEGGPYLSAKVTVDGTRWRYSGGGDCQPRAVAPTGYGQATWTLDPNFRAPSAETRTLHLLVQELSCASGRSAAGRISPAFVTWDERELVIELFVEPLPGEQDCPGAPLTPATLRLPVPLGDRTLFDAGTIGLGGAGG